MMNNRKIRDVAAYVAWVRTEPDITGFSNYYDAYIAKFEPEQNEIQELLARYEEE